jgi:hypothetical protein
LASRTLGLSFVDLLRPRTERLPKDGPSHQAVCKLPGDDSARLAALSFGAIYGVVTIIGLIDGKDVLGLFPVNPADNILHIVLTLAAFAAGLAPLRDRTRASAPRTT